MDRLNKLAAKIGIDRIGITSYQPLSATKQHLEQAIKEGRYPHFVEQSVQKRTDLLLSLPTVKSIVSVAIAYKTCEPESKPGSGVLSRYCFGLDYHQVLRSKMEQLVEHLRTDFGVGESLIAVDTSPLVDRALAVAAGIGFAGYNCAIYTQPFGSWVFLGEILVDKTLPETAPFEPRISSDLCGNCRKCIDACPTNALYAPYTINPHRCISYLTQMKGTIPHNLRRAIGDKLWGCDVCQQVCPHNKKAAMCSHQDFQPLFDTALPLLPILSMSKKEFRSKYGQMAFSWRGLTTIQRNAITILGNSRFAAAIPKLKEILNCSPNPTLRAMAVWSLGEMGDRDSLDFLKQKTRTEKDLDVLGEIDQAISLGSLQ